MTVVLYAFVAAAAYHLGARASITRFLWSRWEGTAWDRFLSCPACSGTWYGMGAAGIGWAFEHPVFDTTSWWTIPLVGAVTMITTPILAAAQERGIYELTGSASES